MKQYFKKTWYMYVIVFGFCFMLFLYEPLMLYLNNIADFFFGISVMFKMSFWLFLIVFIILVGIFNAIYFISEKWYKIAVIIMLIIFLCSYIQGNFLVGNLPVLDGANIIWSNYKVDWLISGILWIIVIGGTIFAIKKLSLNNVIKYSKFVSLSIIFMLSISLFTTLLTVQESKEKKFVPLVTYKNYNEYSSDKNFIVFLIDCVDSGVFSERMNLDEEFRNMFHDFTYYPDTMSAHLYTLESIPLILTGQTFKNDAPISSWSTEAYKNSELFNMMENHDYRLDVYEKDLLFYDKSATRISNVVDMENDEISIKKVTFWKQEIKYIAFRYLPAFLKRYSKIEKMHFTSEYISDYKETNNKPYDPSNQIAYDLYRKEKVDKQDRDIFKFIHLSGAHTPWNLNIDVKEIEKGTYRDMIDGCLTITKSYLNMLKKNDVYDNSVIIIMSDHGEGLRSNDFQRQNPILFVKGINEKHNKMITSQKPIHFSDLSDLYKDLLYGKKSTDVFKKIPNKRTRTFLYYTFADKDSMIEYEATGKVLDKKNIHKTGNEYSIKR